MHTSFSVVIRIVLWLIMIFGGIFFSITHDYNNPFFNSFLFHIFSFPFGLFLIFLAFRAAGNGGRELTKGRVGDIPRLETNRLVTTGIYSCMRHPMLFGLTLIPLGIAFLIGSPTFIMFVAPLEMVFIVFMVTIFEEMEVSKKFGEDYVQYSKKVPMVSFKWSCLKWLFWKEY